MNQMEAKGATALATSLAPWEKESHVAVRTWMYAKLISVFSSNTCTGGGGQGLRRWGGALPRGASPGRRRARPGGQPCGR